MTGALLLCSRALGAREARAPRAQQVPHDAEGMTMLEELARIGTVRLTESFEASPRLYVDVMTVHTESGVVLDVKRDQHQVIVSVGAERIRTDTTRVVAAANKMVKETLVKETLLRRRGAE